MTQLTENNIPIGNWENKYASKNPLHRFLMNNFLYALSEMMNSVRDDIASITEVGCGEGHLSAYITDTFQMPVKACDFSNTIIELAKKSNNRPRIDFYVKSIYNLAKIQDSADMVICCEVLEHLKTPEIGLSKINEITNKYALLSVPLEPYWQLLNVFRGKYLAEFGNTPGHLNHWSDKTFNQFVGKKMKIVKKRRAFPWQLLLCEKV